MASDTIHPDEIREIREALGLSQTAAGQLLGGGPSAFAKYEAGIVKPSASMLKLLHLARTNPDVLDLPLLPASPCLAKLAHFEITAGHIQPLGERELSSLVRRLLHAEADANGLALRPHPRTRQRHNSRRRRRWPHPMA